MKKNAILAISIVSLVLIIDQIIKIWIKTHMALGDEFCVFGSWFRIHFVENNGMAFGMELGGSWGKIILSVFRVVAVFFITYYLAKLCRQTGRTFLVVCISLVLAGAIGNILDSVFYGVIFDSSVGQIATLFPESGGYSTWLHGRVVDMFYMPMIEGHFPDWFPRVGGDSFTFFHPVFNFADAAISIGIVLLFLFQRKELSRDFGGGKDEK